MDQIRLSKHFYFWMSSTLCDYNSAKQGNYGYDKNSAKEEKLSYESMTQIQHDKPTRLRL